jgi:hypothetical protein
VHRLSCTNMVQDVACFVWWLQQLQKGRLGLHKGNDAYQTTSPEGPKSPKISNHMTLHQTHGSLPPSKYRVGDPRPHTHLYASRRASAATTCCFMLSRLDAAADRASRRSAARAARNAAAPAARQRPQWDRTVQEADSRDVSLRVVIAYCAHCVHTCGTCIVYVTFFSVREGQLVVPSWEPCSSPLKQEACHAR